MHGNMNIQISEKYIGFLIRNLSLSRSKQIVPNMLLANFIIVGIVILMLITFSIFILIGKGDDLIAGYNTASKEERAKYDIGRLRKVSGYGLLLTCLPTGLLPLAEMSDILFWSLMISQIVIAIVITILANTYARKEPDKNKQ